MEKHCDVLVVGAGPAGSSAARSAAMNGLSTILIEEDTEIGLPVQCAEAIGKYLISQMPFPIPNNQLIWKTHGMYFWADNLAIIRKGGIWEGFSIDRAKWDKWLASQAIKQGTKIMLNTSLKCIKFNDDYEIDSVIVEKDNSKLIIKPKYIVAADGVNSSVIKAMGLKKTFTTGHVKSYEIRNIDLIYKNYEQMFFGDFAPGGYGYIFPLSKSSANIGIGSLKGKEKTNELFESFINLPFIKKQISKGMQVSEKSGDAPIRNQTEKISYGKVFLVGDAANQNIKPFIEGNIPSIICGNILGNFLKGLRNNEYESKDYSAFIEEKFNLIKESQPYTDLVYTDSKIEQKNFNLILLCLMGEIIKPTDKEINKLLSKNYDNLKEYIIKNGGFVEKNI